jgi:hypothetical protein
METVQIKFWLSALDGFLLVREWGDETRERKTEQQQYNKKRIGKHLSGLPKKGSLKVKENFF